MSYVGRQEQFEAIFPNEPAYRWKQVITALFQPTARSWQDVTSLPASMREKLSSIPWISVSPVTVLESKRKDTHKALLQTVGGGEIETVLMKNRRGYWTICVSSQVGCAMTCRFCATGKMGLKRSLHADEIVDQYRFWKHFLADHPELEQTIGNIVYMGMGEPLANYVHVRDSLNTILAQTEIGKARITVSTVGILPRMETLLTDPAWPHVRLAISLHSADPKTRKEIVPTSFDDFIPKLIDWSRRYLERYGDRQHHLTFEYVMLRGVNDTPAHAKALAELVKKIGNIRVNLISYNFTGMAFSASTSERLAGFTASLENNGVTVMVRKNMGDDIAAACGQLKVEQSKKASA